MDERDQDVVDAVVAGGEVSSFDLAVMCTLWGSEQVNERDRRQSALDQAVANARLSGGEISGFALGLMYKWVEQEIDTDEIVNRLLAHYLAPQENPPTTHSPATGHHQPDAVSGDAASSPCGPPPDTTAAR